MACGKRNGLQGLPELVMLFGFVVSLLCMYSLDSSLRKANAENSRLINYYEEGSRSSRVFSEDEVTKLSGRDHVFGVSPTRMVAATSEYKVISVGDCGGEKIVTLEDWRGKFFLCRLNDGRKVSAGDTVWWDKMSGANIMYKGTHAEAANGVLEAVTQPPMKPTTMP